MNNLYTIQETAAKLGTHASTVRRWVKEGTLVSIILRKGKGRNTIRIPEVALNDKMSYKTNPVKNNN